VSLAGEKNHVRAGPSRADEEAIHQDWSMAKGQAPSWRRKRRKKRAEGGREKGRAGSRARGREPGLGKWGPAKQRKPD